MTTQEKLKIINKDPILWLKNFVKITDNEGNIIPFNVNKEQEHFIKNKERFNIILKSRQLGFTTLMLGLMLHMASIKPHTDYLVLSCDENSLRNIFNRLKMMYESIPDRYKVKQIRCNRSELLLDNGSRIAVKVAKRDAGRSFTCNMILCSEFAFWTPEVQKKGLLSLENALAKNEDACIVLESTANGIGNSYYSIFQKAYKGKSKYKAFFYPYYTNRTQFQHEYKLAEQWYKSENHGQRMLVEDLTRYEKKLYDKGATLKHLMWRQWKLLDYDIDMFNQEYPSIPDEAFISTNIGVFDAKKILERLQNIPKPLTNIDIPNILKPYFNNGLYVYKPIQPNMYYWGGIDAAAGLKGDNTAISILDNNGEQVSVFYRNNLPIYKIAKIAYAIGILFNYCSLLIERNTYGLELINRLKYEEEYVNILRTKKFSAKGYCYSTGWDTTHVSKNKLISDYKQSFEQGLILINNRETLKEMKIYVSDNGKMGNVKGNGNHDDLVDSTALAVQALKIHKRYV